MSSHEFPTLDSAFVINLSFFRFHLYQIKWNKSTTCSYFI